MSIISRAASAIAAAVSSRTDSAAPSSTQAAPSTSSPAQNSPGFLRPRQRLDHLLNLLSGLGGKLDKSQQDVVFDPGRLPIEALDVLYEKNHYAAKVIDKPAEETTRRGFDVITPDADIATEESDPFKPYLKRLHLLSKITDADRWARLYGGALVILIIDDGRESEEAVSQETIREVKLAHVLTRHQVTAGPLIRDTDSPWFGKPEWFTINQGEVDDELSGKRVHVSRCLLYYGTKLSPHRAAQEDHWGAPVLDRVYDAMTNLGMCERSIGNIVHEFTQGIMKIGNLRDMVQAKGGTDKLIERFTAQKIGQKMLGMWLLDADESFEKKTTNVSGLDSLYDRLAQSFASAADMPLVQAFGISPGGLSTDDKAGSRNWNNKLRSRQEDRHTDNVEYACTLVAASSDGPTEGKVPDKLTVKWRPLEEPSEADKADVRLKTAQADAINIDRNVYSAQEARSRYTGTEFTVELALDAEAPQPEPPDETGKIGDVQIAEMNTENDDPDNEPQESEDE